MTTKPKPSIFASEEETASWYYDTYGSYAPLMRGGDTFFRSIFIMSGVLALLIVSSCVFSIQSGDRALTPGNRQQKAMSPARNAEALTVMPKEICGDYHGPYGYGGVCK